MKSAGNFLLAVALLLTVNLSAQTPVNDSCNQALNVKLGKGHFGINTYFSDSVLIDSATVQIGEFFHSSLISAGNDKKTVWFRFYLPARRGINIELKQTANSIGIRDAGFTTFYSNSCLPTSAMATAAKITTLNQFGSSFHPCMEPGWYMVQVSAKARAAGKVYLEITTSFPYLNSGVTDAKYDVPDSAYYFGNQILGKPGYKSIYKDFELGCYTIKDSTEYMYSMGPKFNRYTQSAWFVVKAFDKSDAAMLSIEGYGYYLGSTDSMAYRIYSGDCRGGGALTLLDSNYIDFGSANRCYSYYGALNIHKPCFFDSGKYYTIQLLFHKDESRIVRFTITDATSAFDSFSNYKPISTRIKNFGILGSSLSYYDGFSCQSHMSYNPCPNSNPSGGIRLFGYRYNMSNWYTFTLNEQSKIDLLLSQASNYNLQNPGTLRYRIFRDSVTTNCNDVDTNHIVAQGNGNSWITHMCLEKGNYVLQVLGVDSVPPSYDGCSGNMHLGRDFGIYIYRQRLAHINRFSLFGKKWADSVYVKADTLSPIPIQQVVTMGSDTISCQNNVRPETVCDSSLNKHMYRSFLVGDYNKDGKGDSGLIYFNNMRVIYSASRYRSDHRLYHGNALKLRNTQNVSLFPDTIKGLTPYTPCMSQWLSDASVCVVPGEYTLVSSFDEYGISQTEQPSLSFFSPKTKFTTYATAENLGKISAYSTYYGAYDTFSCKINRDTIDGISCGRRNTYHVFYLDSVSVATIGINYYNAYLYAGVRWSLFTGDIRNGKSGLRRYINDGEWTCNYNYYARSNTDCKPMQPGWYTILVSQDGNFGYDSLSRLNNNYSAYYTHIFPYRVEMSFRKPNVVLPKYDKTFKAANVDSLINGNKPLAWASNYSVKNGMPQHLEKFQFPTEYIQCDLDTPFSDFPKSQLCTNNATNLIYYTFRVSKHSWASISTLLSGMNNYKIKLYNFDVRKYPGKLDTVAPIQNCTNNPTYIEFCNLKPGVYTLVYLVNRYPGQNSYLTPTLYLDSIMTSRFDHALAAYDFGRIPGDSVWYHGKKGDVHPFDSTLYPSTDLMTCRTGSQMSDPVGYSNCYASYNPYVYYKDSFGVSYPNDSAYLYRNNLYWYYSQYPARRNVWYTFTHEGAGDLKIKLNTISQRYVDILKHLRFSVYVSDVDATIPFDSLRKNGGLDSSISQGLKYIVSDNGYSYYCDYPSTLSATINLPICEKQSLKRYYVMVEANNHTESTFSFNHHFSLSLLYDSSRAVVEKTSGDFYSTAISFPDTGSKNLISNNSGQFDNAAWTHTFYNLSSSTNTPNNQGTSLSSWTYYFLNGYIEQNIDLTEFKSRISGTSCSLDLSGNYMVTAGLSGSDGVDFRILYYDSSGNLIQTLSSSAQNCTVNQWYTMNRQWAIPANAARALFRVYVVNSVYSYPTLYLNDLRLIFKQGSNSISRGSKMYSGVVYEAPKNYMGQATVDATDYKFQKSYCGKSVWYKVNIDTSGYLFFNGNLSYASGYKPGYASNYGMYSMRLFRESIPGDSINGFTHIPTNTISQSKIGYASYACVSPGVYYIMFNPSCYLSLQTCLDFVQPLVYLEYHQGDYCSNSIEMQIDTFEKVTAMALVDCKTIGTDFGEDGSDMGCLFGPKGYKSTWFKVSYTGYDKVDLEFKLQENTNSKPAEIRYRTFYGNCQNLTPAPCNTNSQTSFVIDCIRKGTYYIQVITPLSSTGTIQMSVEAKKNLDTTCVPVDIYQPNAAFYYNTSCPENVVEFVNTSTRGDSISYLWDFGYNKITSTELNPFFSYPALLVEKTYRVKLLVSMKSRNSKDSIYIDVVVPYSPLIDIVNNSVNLCDGDSVWLKTNVSHTKGYWNTGSDDDSIKVGRTGTYTYRMLEKPNLLRNANAEQAISNGAWTSTKGSWAQWSYNPYPQDSTYFFSAGTSSGESELTQTINVSKDSVEIDSGIAKISFVGWVWTKKEDVSDQAMVAIEFLDKNNNLLAYYNSAYITTSQEWRKLVHSRTTPKGTRSVKLHLYANNSGNDSYCDAFFDNLTIKMRSACAYQDSVYVQVNPIPVVKLGHDTTLCYHDSLSLSPLAHYVNTVVVDDPMNGSVLKGSATLSASYIPAYKYTVLNLEGSYETGAVNYIDSGLRITDSFDISSDLLIINKDGIEGTWTGFYLFNSQKPTNYSFYTSGGYSIFIQEYANTNIVYIYWGSTICAQFNLNRRLSEQDWKTFRINYNKQLFKFYINDLLIFTYKDNASRTQAGYHFGIISTNVSGSNTHLIRNFYVNRSKSHVKLQTPNNWKFTYHWNDSSTGFNKNILKSGLYTVQAKDGFGCVSKPDSIVIKKIKTYDSLLLQNYKVCSQLDTFRIQAITQKGYFYGNTSIDSSGLVKVSNAVFGINKFYYSVNDSFGCTYKDTGSYVVDSVPNITITPSPPVCRNSKPFKLQVNNTDGFFYGGNYIDSNGFFTPSLSTQKINKVYYRTKGLYCIGVDSSIVNVDTIPSAKIADSGPYCLNAGMQTILHASNAGGKFSGGNFIDSSGRFNPLSAGVGNKKVYYTFTDSRSCKNTDSSNIRVDSIPSAKIAASGPFCLNAGIQTILHASNAGGKFSGGIFIDSSGKFNPLNAGVGTKQIFYTFIDSRSCKNIDSSTIRVDSIPSAKIAASGPFCLNAGMQNILHASNAGGKFSGGNFIDSSGKFNPLSAGVGNKKVYYTFTDSRSCKNTDSTNIRIDSIPSAKIAASGPFCLNAGMQTILHASNSGGKFSGGNYIDSSGRFSPLSAGVGNKKVYYTFTDSRSCKNTDSTNIRIDSIPSAKIAASGPFCLNAGIQTIQHASNAGGKFSGGNYIDSSGKFNPLSAGVGNKKVYYTFTDSRSCKNTDSTNIRIDSIPNAKIAGSGPFCLNAGMQTILHASNSGGKFSGGNYIDSSGKFNPLSAGVGNKKVYYTFIDSRSCKNTDSSTIRVDSIPSAKIAASGPYCLNAGMQTIQHASNAGGKFSGGNYIDSSGRFNPLSAGVGNKKVYYTFTDSRSCKNTDSTNIRVDSIPSAKIAASGPFCLNAGIQTIQHASNAGGKFSGGNYIDSSGKFNPLNAGVGTKKVYYTFTDSRSCKNTDSSTIRVDSIPSAKIAPGGPYCLNAGMQTILHASNAGGKFSGGNYIDSSGKFNPILAGVGNKKVYYTFTDSRSCKNTDSSTIRVDSIPSAKIAASGPYCLNAGMQTIQHASNAGGKFSGGNFIDSSGKFNPLVAGVGNKKVYYTFTDSRSCKNTDSINIRIDSIPSAKIAASGPFCLNAGMQTILHASNAGGKFSGGIFIDSSGKFNPLNAGVGTKKVYYTFTDSRSCKNTDSTNIRIDSIPSAKIAASGPFCLNAGIQSIQHASNAGGKFSGGNYIDSSGKFNPLSAGVGNKNVYYTFIDSRSCKNTDSSTIRVDSIPSAKIAASGPFCLNAGMQTILHASNAGGKFSGGNYIDSSGRFNPLSAGVGNKKVYYTFTDSRSCKNTDSTNIRIDSIPSAKIAPGGPFCLNAGMQTILHASNAGGKFSGGNYIDSSGKFNPLSAGVGNKKVYYTFTDSRSCKNTDSTTIRVDSIPNAALYDAGPFCKNAGLQKIIPKYNSTGQFKVIPGLDLSGNLNPSLLQVGQTKVHYTVTAANLCSHTDSIEVKIDSVPDARIYPVNQICRNANLIQIQTNSNGGSFQSFPFITSTGLFDPGKASIGFNKIYYRISNNKCSSTDSLEIEVLDIPKNSLTVAPMSGCAPLKIYFTTEAADTIRWQIHSSIFQTTSDSTILTNPGTQRLNLFVRDKNGCAISLYKDISVFPPPKADFYFTPTKVYLNQPWVTFNDISTGNVIQWNWNFGDGERSILSNPQHAYTKSGKFTIALLVTDGNGCIDSALYDLTVFDDFVVFIPNAFSPNGNNKNEVFAIEGMGMVSVSCSIFNRWGEKLYESDAFKFWDGTYQGDFVQDGVYLYLFEIKDSKGYIHYLKGEVHVLR